MTSLIAPISSLLAGVALLLLGHGLLNTLLTLRGVAEDYSTGMVGLLMSGYFAGFLIGTWLAPSLIRRIGHIRTFSFYASVAATAANCAALPTTASAGTSVRQSRKCSQAGDEPR